MSAFRALLGSASRLRSRLAGHQNGPRYGPSNRGISAHGLAQCAGHRSPNERRDERNSSEGVDLCHRTTGPELTGQQDAARKPVFSWSSGRELPHRHRAILAETIVEPGAASAG